MKKTIAVFLCILLSAALLSGCTGGQPSAGKYTISCIDQNGDPVPEVVLQVCTPSSCQLMKADKDGTVQCSPAQKDAEIEVHSVPKGYLFPETSVFHFENETLTVTIQKKAEQEAPAAEEIVPADTAEKEEGKKFTFSSTDLSGNPVDENMLKGYDLVFVNCWEPWCGPCMAELPDLEKAYETLKEKNILFLGVTNIMPEPDMKPEDAIQENGLTYPVINYSGDFWFTTDADGMISLPTSFFIGKDGKHIELTNEELSILVRNFYQSVAKEEEAYGNTESAEYYRGLATLPVYSDEDLQSFRAFNGAYSVSYQTPEALTKVAASILSRQ